MAESKKTKKSVELHGKVTGTKFLRLREGPSLESKCLMLLQNEELLIDKKGANDEAEKFYKVSVLGLDGKVCANGYVMKDFVETFEVKKAEPVLEEESKAEPVLEENKEEPADKECIPELGK